MLWLAYLKQVLKFLHVSENIEVFLPHVDTTTCVHALVGFPWALLLIWTPRAGVLCGGKI